MKYLRKNIYHCTLLSLMHMQSIVQITIKKPIKAKLYYIKFGFYDEYAIIVKN